MSDAPKTPDGCPSLGEVFAGRYQLERVLGVGASGVVYAAKHLHVDAHCAVKVLAPALRRDPELVARFLREARAVTKIQSAHICGCSDAGTAEGGVPYLVLELLEGEDLAQRLAAGPVPLDTALGWMIDACSAVAAAHASGVIHRDLKPSNLFLAPSGLKLLDFGISKLMDQDDLSLTHTFWVAGSPLYMSPEQLRSSRDVDARADIWSLGVVTFQVLTGRLPFEATSLAELGALVFAGSTPAARALRREISPELDAVITRCLSVDRAKRFASAEELGAALAACRAAPAASPAPTVPRWKPFATVGALVATVPIVLLSIAPVERDARARTTRSAETPSESLSVAPVPAAASLLLSTPPLPPPAPRATTSALPKPNASPPARPPDFAADRRG